MLSGINQIDLVLSCQINQTSWWKKTYQQETIHKYEQEARPCGSLIFCSSCKHKHIWSSKDISILKEFQDRDNWINTWPRDDLYIQYEKDKNNPTPGKMLGNLAGLLCWFAQLGFSRVFFKSMDHATWTWAIDVMYLRHWAQTMTSESYAFFSMRLDEAALLAYTMPWKTVL